MSPSKKSHATHRSRSSHATGRHGARPGSEIRRPEPREQTHLSVIAALEAIGWRVTELRPAIDHEMWRVTIERTDFAVTMSVTATDPEVAFEELARYTAVDAQRG